MSPKSKPLNLEKKILKIVKQSGTSFYWALRFLPKQKRNAMFAIYAFCRTVDDIADGIEPLNEKLLQLKEWRDKINELYNNNPTDLITHALAQPIQNYNLDKQDFIAIIDGMKTDSVARLRINNKAALMVYCDQVACSVGRLSNNIFGIEPILGQKVARYLGEALQLTNILRDIREDADRDRMYLPRDLLLKHGNNKTAINEILKHPGLIKACEDLEKLNKKRFKQAEDAIKECETKLIKSPLIMMKIYYQLFIRLQRRGWKNFDVPVKMSKILKLWIVLHVLIFKR
jgi:presqualene diphosphate synthase